MHIVIDARFVGPEQTGLGRYTEELLRGLEKVDSRNKYSVLLTSEGMSYWQPRARNFHKVEADFQWYSIREQLAVPKLLRRLNPDLVHFCHFNVPILWRRPFVVTIHDLTKDEFKGKESTTRSSFVYSLKHWAYKLVIRHAVLGSKSVITISEASLKKIVKKYSIPRAKIAITYEAADPRFSKYRQIELTEEDRKKLSAKYKFNFPFLLYVGNAYPYKNLTRLLQALKNLDSSVSLVNPCARSVFYDKLKEQARSMGLSKRVVLPGFVPDEDLAKLYRAASAYVFPSLSEGFGLPLLEAQMAGLPVAASSTPPLPEVGGAGALYFDPYDISDITRKLKTILTDNTKRDDLVAKGDANLKRFDWKKTARQTLVIYQKKVAHGIRA
ncbi:glycosyltransferase family 4 protein [Patescibacteria group bacterium]